MGGGGCGASEDCDVEFFGLNEGFKNGLAKGTSCLYLS